MRWNRHLQIRTRDDDRSFLSGKQVLLCLSGILLALNLVLLYGILFSSRGIPGFHQQYQQIAAMESKILHLRSENQRLFQKIQSLKSDPQAQERLIRDQLGWVKPNEIMVEFPSSGKDQR
ncbi:MAG: septum formation initiator family protein [Syntrophobacteraceae bacterium]|nr:septum formation initiator family protein [Syntrophobacteraceae bacterium]